MSAIAYPYWAGINPVAGNTGNHALSPLLNQKTHKDTAYERFWPSGPFALPLKSVPDCLDSTT